MAIPRTAAGSPGRVLPVAALALALLRATGAGAEVLPVTPAPAALAPLEQQMATLQVSSERYEQVVDGTVETETHGDRRSTPVDRRELGEVALAPTAGEIDEVVGGKPRPLLRLIGRAGYVYSAKLGRRDQGRPWVRSDAHGTVPGELIPYDGNPQDEVAEGGSGPFANLLNLLNIAIGGVTVGGQVSVDGQQTTEFSASVHELELVRGVSEQEGERIPPEQLVAFITAAGVPLRISAHIHVGRTDLMSTVTILALNVPVSVRAPAHRLTVSEAQADRYGGSGVASSGSG